MKQDLIRRKPITNDCSPNATGKPCGDSILGDAAGVPRKRFSALIMAAFFMAASVLAVPGTADAKKTPVRAHKYVDKFLQARQHHRVVYSIGRTALPASFSVNGKAVPVGLSESMRTLNYFSDKFSYDAERGIGHIIKASNPSLAAEQTESYTKHIISWAKHFSLPPLLVASVIHVESNFRTNCYYLGNYGPMQVNLTAHKTRLQKKGIAVSELMTVPQGVHVGCEILKECIKRAGGNYVRALTSYNGAMDPMYAAKVLKMYSYGRAVS